MLFSDSMLMAAIDKIPMVFVSATNATAAGSSVSVNKPSGAQAGDLGVMVVTHFGNNPVSTGWTQRQNDATGTTRNRILTRLFDGSEGATFSVTGVGTPDGVTILLFRGGSALFDVAGASHLTASGTTPVAPSLTATQLGILLAIFAHASSGATISTPPAGMTQRVFYNTGGGGAAIAVYELNPSAVGASGTKTLVWSNSASNASVLAQIY